MPAETAESATPHDSAEPAGQKAQGTILIVDDEESNRLLFRLLLRAEGYRFLEAGNGQIALDILREKPVDLVILDLMMPIKDGFSVLEDVQNDTKLRNVPIIIASALSEPEQVERGLRLGAIDYLHKPLSEDVRKFQLKLKARNLVNLKHLRDELAAMQEERLIQERDRTVIEMAGAASHEINQPLTVIMGRLELLLRHLPKEDEKYKEVEIIYNQAGRIADIVHNIGKITRYEKKKYVGDSSIIDISAASSDDPPDDKDSEGTP